MYKVETHNNSREYFERLTIEDCSIYVTSNKSLSNMIIERGKIKEEDRWKVLDIENFIKNIYPNWTDTINNVKLQNEIRMAILKVKEKIKNENELKEIKFLEDNVLILYSDFSYLVEAGVRKLSYISSDVKLNLIKEIFNIFSQSELFKEMSNEVLNIENIKRFPKLLVKKYLDKLSKNDRNKANEIKFLLDKKANKITKIYFYNINNLDLKRYMISEILKYAGYEVIFRIPHFEGLNAVNKCWDKVYRDSKLFSIEINEKYKLPYNSNVKYVDFLEGNVVKEGGIDNVTIKNYKEIYDFKKSTKNKNVITLHKDSLKSIKERENLNLKNHCYQSAIGRFIYNLYDCKIDDGNVKISFDTYREMITSGWIEVNKWNGIKLQGYLAENEEYFNGTSDIDDILERIEKLKEINEVGNIFEEQAKDRIRKNQTKQFLSNPFRAFSYYNFEKYNITANYLYEVTLRLKRFLIKAFEGEDEIINVENHFKMLSILFRNTYIIDKYNNGSETQQKIIKRIFGLLNNPSAFGELVHKESLSDLFNIYLIIDEDVLEEIKQEEEFSIDQLEGLMYIDRLFKFNRQPIYIGDISYKSYEKYRDKSKEFNKILNIEDTKFIFEKELKGKNKEIVMEGLKLQKHSKEANESYLKFAVANLLINYDGEIEFSWIEALRKDDSKAILLKQLESLYGDGKNVPTYLDKDEFVEEEEMELYDINSHDLKTISENKIKVPEVAFRDLDFCGDKFLYSSIVEGYPTYSTEFHQRLVFSSLISIFKNNIEDSYIGLLKYILPMFPQWTDVVKRNILDCEFSRKGLREYRYFEGINYPKSTDALYILKSKYIVTENNKIRNRYNKGEFNGERYYKEFIEEYIEGNQNNSGLHCKMCPHNFLCKKGEFAVDRI